MRAWRARNPEHTTAYNARRRVAPREFICPRCGGAFTALRRDRLYCTMRCRLALHRSGLRAVLPQLIALHGAICWICTKPIDVGLRWPHSLYATVDHVRPRARGGTHAIENLRPAHMLCNATRGARPTTAVS